MTKLQHCQIPPVLSYLSWNNVLVKSTLCSSDTVILSLLFLHYALTRMLCTLPTNLPLNELIDDDNPSQSWSMTTHHQRCHNGQARPHHTPIITPLNKGTFIFHEVTTHIKNINTNLSFQRCNMQLWLCSTSQITPLPPMIRTKLWYHWWVLDKREYLIYQSTQTNKSTNENTL